jgi:hypothetical protein
VSAWQPAIEQEGRTGKSGLPVLRDGAGGPRDRRPRSGGSSSTTFASGGRLRSLLLAVFSTLAEAIADAERRDAEQALEQAKRAAGAAERRRCPRPCRGAAGAAPNLLCSSSRALKTTDGSIEAGSASLRGRPHGTRAAIRRQPRQRVRRSAGCQMVRGTATQAQPPAQRAILRGARPYARPRPRPTRRLRHGLRHRGARVGACSMARQRGLRAVGRAEPCDTHRCFLLARDGPGLDRRRRCRHGRYRRGRYRRSVCRDGCVDDVERRFDPIA